MNYIGIDLGTSSVKGLLIDEHLKPISKYSLDYPLLLNDEGWSEQSPEEWLDKTILVLKELLSKSKEKIGAISFSGQMHGLVALDSNDNILRNAILWNDQRSFEEVNYLNNVVSKEKLIDLVGNVALTGFTLPKLLWMKDNEPDLYKSINKIMLPKDYLVYKLTGIFATDYSDASGTFMLNVEDKVWSKELLELLNIKESILPKLYNSYDKVSLMNKEFSNLLNVDYDIDIVVGGGDQAVGSIGTGATSQGDINISLGTSGVVFAPLNEYIKDKNGSLHNFCDATGKFHKMGVALTSAGSMKWWSDILGTIDFDEMEKLMINIGANEPLYFLPYLIGERSPINDHKIRASFIGLSLHHKKEHMTLSIMEGVAFSIRQMYELMEVDNEPNIMITSGGAKSKLWVKIIANVLKSNINVIEESEGPAFGAALLAYSSYNKLNINEISKKAVKIKETIKPDDNIHIYQNKYEKWLKIYPSLKNLEL
ncbi:MAG: xylulokinase [Mycoplasmatales bacterium]